MELAEQIRRQFDVLDVLRLGRQLLIRQLARQLDFDHASLARVQHDFEGIADQVAGGVVQTQVGVAVKYGLDLVLPRGQARQVADRKDRHCLIHDDRAAGRQSLGIDAKHGGRIAVGEVDGEPRLGVFGLAQHQEQATVSGGRQKPPGDSYLEAQAGIRRSRIIGEAERDQSDKGCSGD